MSSDSPQQNLNQTREREDEFNPRRQRAEEKSELAALNNRLEFCLLRLREREASEAQWQKEIQAIKQRSERELEAQKHLHESEISGLQQEREEQAARIAELEENLDKSSQDLKTLSDELVSERTLQAKSKEKYGMLSTEVDRLKTHLNSIEAKQKEAENDIELKESQIQKAQEELDNLRRQYTQIYTNFRDMEARALAAEAKDERQRIENDYLRKRVDELSSLTSRSEQQVRDELSKRVASALDNRYDQWKKQNEDDLIRIRASYESKLNGYRKKLEQSGHEVQQERQKNHVLKRQLDEANNVNASLKLEKDGLRSQVDRFNHQLESERQQHREQRADHVTKMEKFKTMWKRREKDYDELSDFNISNSGVVKAIKDILEEEENRLGLQNPFKKRRLRRDSLASVSSMNSLQTQSGRGSPADSISSNSISGEEGSQQGAKTVKKPVSDVEYDLGVAEFPEPASSSISHISSSSSSSLSSSSLSSSSSSHVQPLDEIDMKGEPDGGDPGEEENGEGKVLQEGEALEPGEEEQDRSASLMTGYGENGQPYITIRNGPDETVFLKGWSLQGSAGAIFPFPDDLQIGPGELLSVRLEEEGSPKSSIELNAPEGTQILIWKDSKILDPYNALITLRNPEGSDISKVAFPLREEPEPAQQPSKEKEKSSCVLM